MGQTLRHHTYLTQGTKPFMGSPKKMSGESENPTSHSVQKHMVSTNSFAERALSSEHESAYNKRFRQLYSSTRCFNLKLVKWIKRDAARKNAHPFPPN